MNLFRTGKIGLSRVVLLTVLVILNLARIVNGTLVLFKSRLIKIKARVKFCRMSCQESPNATSGNKMLGFKIPYWLLNWFFCLWAFSDWKSLNHYMPFFLSRVFDVLVIPTNIRLHQMKTHHQIVALIPDERLIFLLEKYNFLLV